MSSFTEPLIVEKIGKRLWKIHRSFEYHIGSEDSSEIVKVPKGFKTDFASSPWVVWWIVPPDGEYSQATVLHDYMYYKFLYTRKRCDDIFLEAMAVLKVNPIKRYLMYRAVRDWGWIGWNMHKRREK